MLILPRYNDIFGYFTAISLYRESRYWHIVISGFHCSTSDVFMTSFEFTEDHQGADDVFQRLPKEMPYTDTSFTAVFVLDSSSTRLAFPK